MLQHDACQCLSDFQLYHLADLKNAEFQGTYMVWHSVSGGLQVPTCLLIPPAPIAPGPQRLPWVFAIIAVVVSALIAVTAG